MVCGISKLLALAAFLATVAAQSCPCSRIYSPICGSDGTTYGNHCNYLCAKANNPDLIIHHEGKCLVKRSDDRGPSCPCTRELRILCGTDGKTYKNPCLLECAKKTNPDLEEAHPGPCAEKRGQKWTCACPYNYSPVCGSDGTTYGNECALHCAQNTKADLTLSHSGECFEDRRKRSIAGRQELCPCTKERNPMCGTNGKTYANPCLFRCAAKSIPGLKLAHSGPC